ncbi:MAG: PIN domain-containing protein [Cellulomonadaceae bacterium]|nr:PIN domain-containing protein [Cellulomonadaceae bacterium]
MIAFDADVLIYAAQRSHPHGDRIAALFVESPPRVEGPETFENTAGPDTSTHHQATAARANRRGTGFNEEEAGASSMAGCGSVMLLPEILSHPLRNGREAELLTLTGYLGRLALVPLDRSLAAKSVEVAAEYGLRAADAVHLATALFAGARFFLTNNRKDFSPSIPDIRVIYPEDLPPA